MFSLRPCRSQRVQQVRCLGADRRDARRRTAASKAQNDVESIERRAAQAHRFAQHAFEPVAVDRELQLLLADHVSYLADRASGRHRQQLQMFGFDATALAKQPGERRRPTQSVPLIRAYCGFATALDREPGAALGAPRAQDLAAADAFHPGAKAVRPLAPDDRRLVGALHDLFPFEKSLTLERFA